jgi:hypothetical protein
MAHTFYSTTFTFHSATDAEVHSFCSARLWLGGFLINIGGSQIAHCLNNVSRAAASGVQRLTYLN